VAELEKLLGSKAHEAFSQFDREVTLWLLSNGEYRDLTSRIFDRGCEMEGCITEESFQEIATDDEREILQRLTREAEAAVRAGLS